MSCHRSPSALVHIPSLHVLICFVMQTSQADIHAKVMRAIGERDILHEATVRATQEQYAREIANLREELLEARRR